MVIPAPPLAVLRLQARAQQVRTVFLHGHILWHCWGNPHSPQAPWVLLHGGSGSWTHWARNIDHLVAAGLTVWAPDLPGFGDSAPLPAGSDADAIVAPLHAGLRALPGTPPGTLVGFSLGGMVAGLLAAQYPQAVQRLVLVGAVAMGVVQRPLYRLQGWRHLPTPDAQDAIHHHNLTALMLHDAAHIDAHTLALHRHNVWRDRLPRRRLAHTDTLARALPHVICPVHALYGAHDAVYQGHHAALEQTFRAVTPQLQSYTRIAHAGHWVQYEQPEAFATALAPLMHDEREGARDDAGRLGCGT